MLGERVRLCTEFSSWGSVLSSVDGPSKHMRLCLVLASAPPLRGGPLQKNFEGILLMSRGESRAQHLHLLHILLGPLGGFTPEEIGGELPQSCRPP